MIKGIAHACYRVRDLERTAAFYRDVLGLPEAFDFRDDDGNRFGVYLHVGERTFIELFAGTPDIEPAHASYQHLCLEVDDLETTVEELRARGIETTDPKLGDDRSWQAWIEDPDGNRIELHQYTPESKQRAAFEG